MTKPLLDVDSLPRTRGQYRRVVVELSPNGTSGTVIAKCTGSKCGAAVARIAVDKWRSGVCAHSCGRCVADANRSHRE